MKKFFLLCLLTLAAVCARAQSSGQLVTATVTFTAQPTNGSIFSVNGVQRTWTNVVYSASTQILSNQTTLVGVASNCFTAYASYSAPQATVVWVSTTNANMANVGTNILEFISYPGYPMVVTNGGAGNLIYFTVSYFTNLITNAMVARLPITAIGAYERTNLESGLVGALSDTAATNVVDPTAHQWVNFAALTNAFIPTVNNVQFSRTNWLGTNHATYWATNLSGAGTNALLFTNVNPGSASLYFVTVTLWSDCRTNPVPLWLNFGATYTVTNGTGGSGAIATNNAFTNAGSGITLTTFSNSVTGSGGFGITALAAATNELYNVAKIEVTFP